MECPAEERYHWPLFHSAVIAPVLRTLQPHYKPSQTRVACVIIYALHTLHIPNKGKNHCTLPNPYTCWVSFRIFVKGLANATIAELKEGEDCSNTLSVFSSVMSRTTRHLCFSSSKNNIVLIN